MTEIFKISNLINDNEQIIYVFIGNLFKKLEGSDASKQTLFKNQPSHLLFKEIFSEDELRDIHKYNTTVLLSPQAIFIDDTISIIKKKIILEFNQEIAFEEIYLN